MSAARPRPPALVIGHRGAAGHEPENTLRSIDAGIALGADFVEIDVQRTADGHLVVMHDKRIDRTTDGHGYVSEMLLTDVRAVDAGGGQPVPLFAEVLRAVSGRSGLMIEIITPGLAAAVVDAVRTTQIASPVVYASFHHAELLAVRDHDPEARTVALFEGVPVDVGFLRAARVTHVGLAFDSVTEAFVRDLQDGGLTVFAYTLNDPRDIARAHSLGLDGIITDYPERARR